MLLSKEEKETLLAWAKRHTYASNSFISFVAPFNDKIYIDLGFHTLLYNIRVRVDRKASWFSKWVFGPYEWKAISFEEDGPWWDDIRKELPSLLELDKKHDADKEFKRKLEVTELAKEYTK